VSPADEIFNRLFYQLPLPTFKYVADHIEFNIRPRQETMDHHAISLHCTRVMAVKDRIDRSALSDECRSFDIASVHLTDVLAKERIYLL